MQARVTKPLAEPAPTAFVEAHSAPASILEARAGRQQPRHQFRSLWTDRDNGGDDADLGSDTSSDEDDDADLNPDTRPAKPDDDASLDPNARPAEQGPQTPLPEVESDGETRAQLIRRADSAEPARPLSKVRERVERARASTERDANRQERTSNWSLVEEQNQRIALLEEQLEKYRSDNSLLKSDLKRMEATLRVVTATAPTDASPSKSKGPCKAGRASRSSSFNLHGMTKARRASTMPVSQSSSGALHGGTGGSARARRLWRTARCRILAVVRLCLGMRGRRALAPRMARAIEMARVLRPRAKAPTAKSFGMPRVAKPPEAARIDERSAELIPGYDRRALSAQKSALQWLEGELCPDAETRKWLEKEAALEASREASGRSTPSADEIGHSRMREAALGDASFTRPRLSPAAGVPHPPEPSPQTDGSARSSPYLGEPRHSPVSFAAPGGCLEPRRPPSPRLVDSSGTWLSLLMGHLGQPPRAPALFRKPQQPAPHTPLSLDRLQRLDVADPPSDTAVGGSKDEASEDERADKTPPAAEGTWTGWLGAGLGVLLGKGRPRTEVDGRPKPPPRQLSVVY